MTIYQTLQTIGLPVVYSHFRDDSSPVEPPYIAYIGAGQNTMSADDTWYWRENLYQIEYYFKTKSETNETAIENALLSAGYRYGKSEDIFIEDEGVFVIYYTV